jgi:hypothetical protein
VEQCNLVSAVSDRKNIHAAIEQTVGFDNLNFSIVEVMERWMMQQFEQQAETLDEEDSHMTKAQMARLLSDQRMYEEAMALEEQILAHFKKTLPEHHSNIGLAMSNLAISYRHCECQGVRFFHRRFHRIDHFPVLHTQPGLEGDKFGEIVGEIVDHSTMRWRC